MPEVPVTLTTFTPTGSRRARELFGQQVRHLFVPIDLPGAARRLFRHVQPRLLIVMETEIWPNLILEAKARGIRVLEVKDEASRDFAGGSLQITSRGDQGSRSVTGTVFADGDLRITSIDEFPVNVTPSSHMLFTRHRDMPGIIGQLGSMLGAHNVNIAAMQVGRKIVRGDAVMVLSIDDPIPADLLATLTGIDGIQEAHPVTL